MTLHRGRPKKYHTEAERLAARERYAALAAAKKKGQNVVVLRSDLLKVLNEHALLLETQLGFRPTVEQTLRYVLTSRLQQEKDHG